MIVIGLTGGIASGKSTVAKMLEEKRVIIIDADKIARTIVEPGKEAWKEIVAYFGTGILNDDQTINRNKLGQIIFKDQTSRKKINKITHPTIIDEIKTLIRYYENKGENVIAINVPLLIETNMIDIVDTLWVVYVPLEVQLKRLMQRNNFSKEDALMRIKSQMSLEEKVKYADVVIDNTGSIEETKAQVDEAYNKIFPNV